MGVGVHVRIYACVNITRTQCMPIQLLSLKGDAEQSQQVVQSGTCFSLKYYFTIEPWNTTCMPSQQHSPWYQRKVVPFKFRQLTLALDMKSRQCITT